MFPSLLQDIDEAGIFQEPLLFCHFALGIGEPKYMPVADWPAINKILVEALESYNELNAAMNLVLFEAAMQHILRINRILENPRGNALLVGVGGSGKQSLSRLSAFISSLEVFQVTLRKGYGIPDLKLDLAALYMKAGVKNIGTMFLMTDAQVSDEKFLVLINDLLASGEIPDLFPDEDFENIINAVRNEVKSVGLQDTRENCWKFFIDRVRRMLKVCEMLVYLYAYICFYFLNFKIINYQLKHVQSIISCFESFLKKLCFMSSFLDHQQEIKIGVRIYVWIIFVSRWCCVSPLSVALYVSAAGNSLQLPMPHVSIGSTNGLKRRWSLYPVASWKMWNCWMWVS